MGDQPMKKPPYYRNRRYTLVDWALFLALATVFGVSLLGSLT